MGMHHASFEDRLTRLHDTTGQIYESDKIKPGAAAAETAVNDEPAKDYDRSRWMFSALMVTSFLGVCALGLMAFDLTVSVDNFLEVANR